MPPDQNSPAADDSGEGPRVLVAEGDPEDRALISDVIRARGFGVVVCETGEHAWEVFREKPVDMVVVSARLAGLDGEALCRRIRERSPGGSPVILGVMWRGEPGTLAGMLDAGVDDVVQKPIVTQDLEVRLSIAERHMHRAKTRKGRSNAAALEAPRVTPLANLHEVFASIDVSAGRLTGASPQTRTLFGIPSERLVRDPDLWRDYFKVSGGWEDLGETPPGSSVDYEYPVTTPSGDARWIRSSVSVERDPATGGLRADGVFADTTSEHEAHLVAAARNEELTALHRLSELILDAATLDEGYQRIVQHLGEVLECPVAAIELLDPDRDRLTVVASRGIEILDDDDLSVPLHHTLSGMAVRTGEPLFVTDPQTRNEHQAPFLVRMRLQGYAAFPLSTGDEVRGTIMLATLEPRKFDEHFRRMGARLATTVAVYLDRLEAEAALKSSEARYRTLAGQLQQANDELESFAYSVSHDLRAPLRTMQGFAHALIQDFGDELPPRARDFAERIIAAGGQSEALINDLLTYSRLSFEQVDLKIVELDAVVSAVLEQARADLAESGAEVEVDKKLPKVLANHITLVQVLGNLLGNALKFVPPGRVPRVKITAEDLGDRARVLVEDNGIGVPQGQEDRIFRVFERLSEGDGQAGTGIGLAIVRRGMQRIRGSCGVEPSPSGGSVFWIEILKERRSSWRGPGRRRG